MKVENKKTGMVSPPKEASKYIMQVLDEYTGALMIAVPITQDDFDFLNLLGSKEGKTVRSLIEEIITPFYLKDGLNSEEATRRELSRRF